MNYKNISDNPDAVAVIGLSGIFPQAKNVNQYWDNLINGVESVVQYSNNKSETKGHYVRAAATIDDVDKFDAKFFNYSAYEAEIMDPQHRLFLECCWNALEDAGYSPEKAGNVGVFAGSNISTYFMLAHQANNSKIDTTYLLQLLMGNDKDYLSTRVSYKLNLTGPSVCVQSACSTSLLSIHTAVQSLLNGECDMALAGGVNISVPQEIEYEYKEGMIFSPDGHCRAFDADAKGTVAGNGVGVVVVKRLEDAINDGDSIDAVILGSAVNNDGASKIGYTAPSIEGQSSVIANALALADVPVTTIDYIETHGTGTPLGDPIEIRSLTQVFKNETDKTGYCAIGSVKPNIGHLNSAAGIASFIKTVLSLKNAQIPPSLHYKKANPEIDFDSTPFFVNAKPSPWPKRDHPRRAGVSSFGFGGTNVHMVIEQAPELIKEEQKEELNLIVLSAQKEERLEALAKNYNEYLNDSKELLKDISFTSIEGRKHHNDRLAIVAKDHKDLQKQLQEFVDNKQNILAYKGSKNHSAKIAALFTGQGSTYAHMAKELYESNKIFKDSLDLCAKGLEDLLDIPLLKLMFGESKHTDLLVQTKYTQPTLFSLEYSLYQMYKAMGVEFDVLAGHSVGEIVAACVAEIFSLADALKLITARGNLVQSLESNHGGMLTIFANKNVVDNYLSKYSQLSIAAQNGPEHIVLSGENTILEELSKELEKDALEYTKLKVSHAFHSSLLDPILDKFEELVASFEMKKPQIPIVSNLYGRIVKEDEITTAKYWREHMRKPVLFMDSIQALENMGVNCFLECGPHPVLTNMGKKCVNNNSYEWIHSLQRNQEDQKQILSTIAKLYCFGIDIKWDGLGKDKAQRVSIPTYPFEKQRYWLGSVENALENQSNPLNIWEDILSAGNKQAQIGSEELNIPKLKNDERILVKLAQSFIIKAFRSLNLFTQNKKYKLTTILEKIVPQYHQLAQRFLEELHMVGLVESKEDEFWQLQELTDTHIQEQKEICRELFLENPAFETVYLNSGEQLADVLCGKTKAIDAMMMDTSIDDAKEIYADLPTSSYFNALLRETVKSWVNTMPKNQTLRILEIGSGTGATSEQLIPLLPKERSTYYYTDVSPLFLQRASKIFEEYKFVNYTLFDINKVPKDQGIEHGSFDLIIASNVLHAADDLQYTMSNVSKLLKPNGMLFMYEIIKETLIGELTTGLLLPVVKDTKLRGIQPFMTKGQWENLMKGLGFKNFHSIPEEGTNMDFIGERILLAQQQENIIEEKEDKNYFYNIGWDKNNISVDTIEESLKQSTNWIICGDKIGYTTELASVLNKHNQKVYNLSIDISMEELHKTLKEVFNEDKPVQILYLWGIDNISLDTISASQLQDHQTISTLRLLDILSSLSQINLSNLKNLNIVTNGSQVTNKNENIALSQSTLWGFSQVVAIGHPELNVKLIDFDPNVDTKINAKTLIQNLQAKDNEEEYQLVLRENNSYLPRVKSFKDTKPISKVNIEDKGYYAIAGGLGGLGLKTASWLKQNGAKNILLIGRSKANGEATKEIQSLKDQGINIQVAQADITDYDALKSIFDNLDAPLKGIIHSAVVRDKETLGELPQDERMLAVISPKLKGAWNLHKISLEHKELDLFILYSSSVSLIPARGIPEYVASNAFMDGLAHYRKTINLPSLSVSWGAWAEVGTVANTTQQEQLKQNGLNSMSVKESFNCLEKIINNDSNSHFGIFDVNWDKLLLNYPKDQLSSYFKEVLTTSYIKEQKGSEENLAAQQHKLLENLKIAKSEEESLGFISDYLIQKVAVILRINADEVPMQKDLLHLGIDSLMFLDLLNNLNQLLQTKVKPNEVMANLNIKAISEHLFKAINDTDTSDIRELLIKDKASLTKPFPLTDIQQAYWIGRDQHMDLGNVACHGYMEIDCKDLNISSIEEAWNKLIQRHEMLRCIILPFGQQNILDDVPDYHFEVRDFRNLSKDECTDEIDKLRVKSSHRVPKTDEWPLFDIHATKLQDGITRLHISLDNIMTDGRSIGIMLSEWVHIYNKPKDNLPDLDLTFRDYIMTFEAFKQTADYTKAKDYWVDRIENIYPSPQLPLIKAPSEVSNPKFIRREFHLSQEKWEKLRSFASQKAGLTPSGILLSVYAQVLSLWSNSAKFTLNVPTFNRLAVHPQVNNIIGEFTSLILLSLDYTKKLSFKDQSSILQKQLLKDQAYDSFSGVSVMRELAKNGQSANMPVVFTSTFGLTQNVNTTFSKHEKEAQVLGEQVYTISQTPQVYIDNHVHDYGGSLNVYWDCVDELFPEGVLDSMFEAYGNLLENLASDEQIWESTQPIPLPKEQEQKLFKYNDTTNVKYLPKENDLLSGFLEQVQNQAQKIALVSKNDKLSYKELYDRSCFIAKELKQTSFKPLDRVAIILPKSWQQISSVIATLGVNGIYVPFDYDLPQKRLEQLLEVAEISHVITSKEMAETLDKEDISFIIPPKTWSEKEQKEIKDTPIEFKPSNNQDLAYIIYTSGSTGIPKGVMTSHDSALNTILDINDRFKVSKDDVIFGLSGLHFDLSVYDIFGALNTGASLVLPDQDKLKEADHWMELIQENKISIWNSVPALCQMALIQVNANKLNLANLRLVLLSGDWIPLTLKNDLEICANNAKLYSLGGATEAAIWSIYYPVNDIDSTWNSIPYGTPLANQEFYVLNEKLQNCPELVEGNLYIGGAGLAKGYWKDEEKTKESFIIHPHTGKKLYKTGDRGRFHPNGYIEFLGRNDFQVKINGYRIELSEIESCLQEHEKIQSVIVTAIDNYGNNDIATSVKNNKQKLVAYCISKDENSNEIQEQLKKWLSDRLPDYMVPNHFFILKSIPLTSNGKLDRKALPLPNNEIDMDKNAIAQTQDEKLLISLCKEILLIDKISLNSNFFDIGGDSLQATKLSVSLQEQGFELNVKEIFLNPILKNMTKHIKTNKENKSEAMIAVEFNNSSSILTSLNSIDKRKQDMFCIHGSDGGILVFNELANQLEDDFNIYGIGAQNTISKNSISDIASSYLNQIKSKADSQVPVLCGFSSGGFVAWEIARQLEQKGEDLAKLILIDTQFLPKELKDNSLLVLILFSMTFGLKIDSLPIKEDLLEKVLNNTYIQEDIKQIPILEIEEFEELFNQLMEANSASIEHNKLRNKFDIFKQYVDFSIGYELPYLSEIDTLLLQAKESAANHISWHSFGDKVQHIEVEGNHISCLQHPNVSSISNTIQNFIKR